NLGLAFQLVDDALDYGGTKSELGKNVGDDFHEGKITLPVLLAYRRGSDEERAFWRANMEADEAAEGALDEAMALLKKHGAIDDTVARARHYGEMARDALAPLPAGEFKDALLDVVAFCVGRVS
ncbi:MAG: polyprenyl synthetase family protein, partial [Pseudomonadota bacterium]